MRVLRSVVNGIVVNASAGPSRVVCSPVDGSPAFTVQDASRDDVHRSVLAARSAFEGGGDWGRRSTGAHRRDMLWELSSLMLKERSALAEQEAVSGKPVTDALADVDASVECFRFFAGLADKLHGRTFAAGASHRSYTLREPVGVCGLITPFNYPLLLASWKLAPALAAGNACIVKPAPQTPSSTLTLAALARRAGAPAGALDVLLGGSDIGAWLAAHPDVDKLSFTGSTAAGARVASLLASGDNAGDAAAAAQHAGGPRPATLELGGKNSVLVCADADLDAACTHVVDAGFSNMGQNCCAGSRLLLHRSIHDRFLDMVLERVKTLKVGDPMDPSTRIGPLVDEAALSRVLGFIERAKRDGAKVLVGGKRVQSKGYFVEPTIVTNVADDSEIAMEEIFGPIVTVLAPFDDIQEAVLRANQTRYGLAAGIFARDTTSTEYAISNLKTGFVWVNNYNDCPPFLSLGGRKASGYGYEMGMEALDEFTKKKSVHILLQ
ncbi:aldehyde dehydrogenase domain-containing protein [Zopfochytrium polystomum]|nr:aldehyde dehydrogenase domain-containing protein [Zopfochytrium polystomum]